MRNSDVWRQCAPGAEQDARPHRFLPAEAVMEFEGQHFRWSRDAAPRQAAEGHPRAARRRSERLPSGITTTDTDAADAAAGPPLCVCGAPVSGALVPATAETFRRRFYRVVRYLGGLDG
jgi:hypothetical protein